MSRRYTRDQQRKRKEKIRLVVGKLLGTIVPCMFCGKPAPKPNIQFLLPTCTKCDKVFNWPF